MSDNLKMRISFEIDGKLARAMLEEQTKILRLTGSAAESAKSTIGRAAIVEYLNARGYRVEDSTKWGGRQATEEGDEKELIGV